MIDRVMFALFLYALLCTALSVPLIIVILALAVCGLPRASAVLIVAWFIGILIYAGWRNTE